MLEKKRTYSENKVTTIVGAGTEITGDIRSKGTLRIEGKVKGRIQCDDSVVVMDSGVVEADIVAGQVIVSGAIQGNIFAHDRLEASNKARLIGNITSPTLSIAEGGFFEGHCIMKPAGEAKPPNFDQPLRLFQPEEAKTKTEPEADPKAAGA